MAIPDNLQLNLGNYPNDGTGDDLFTAFQKVKDTFDLLDTELGVTNAEGAGTVGQSIVANPSVTNNTLQLKKIIGLNGVNVTSNDTTISIAALASLVGDMTPRLGGNLNLNGYHITGSGDVETTVWGIDIRTLNDVVNTLINTADFGNTDLGTFTSPLGGNFDLGTL